MSFCKGMKQNLADLQLLQLETKETASELFLWHTSEDPKHVRERCTTGIGCLFFFCNESVRELRDLVGMAKTKSNTIYGGTLARTSSIEQDTCATNKIVKS